MKSSSAIGISLSGLGGWPGLSINGRGGHFNLYSFMASQSDGLFFDFLKTDRHFQEDVGPTLAEGNGDPFGLALDQRNWGGKTLADMLATQPDLSLNMQDASGTLANMSTSIDASLTIVADPASPAASGKAFRLQNPTAGNRFANIVTNGVVAGKIYLVQFWAKADTTRTETLGFASGTSLIVPLTTSWRHCSAFLTAPTNNAVAYIRAIAGRSTDFVLNSVKEVSGNHAIQTEASLKPARQSAGAKFDGSDDYLLTSYAPSPNANFIVAHIDVPASVTATQIVAGSNATTEAGRFYLGITTGGAVRLGIGDGAQIDSSGMDVRGQSLVIGISADQSIARIFADGALRFEGARPAGAFSGAALNLGCRNNNGTAGNFFGGTIRKIVAGRQMLDLPIYLKIKEALTRP